ncbi:pentapeptide MXKDX repeat protein [Amycolatopsis sulphurea]|uniref:Pentapeptide MXKDX repeat protein n=1 Tax=Amycolatopsis sulphurea TaxID=76022 RepID=A0A2A9FFZ1_9PSEU|nr:pentapeptide MXKDX repeat protein [Amycolatopsis sulphurea]
MSIRSRKPPQPRLVKIRSPRQEHPRGRRRAGKVRAGTPEDGTSSPSTAGGRWSRDGKPCGGTPGDRMSRDGMLRDRRSRDRMSRDRMSRDGMPRDPIPRDGKRRPGKPWVGRDRRRAWGGRREPLDRQAALHPEPSGRQAEHPRNAPKRPLARHTSPRRHHGQRSPIRIRTIATLSAKLPYMYGNFLPDIGRERRRRSRHRRDDEEGRKVSWPGCVCRRRGLFVTRGAVGEVRSPRSGFEVTVTRRAGRELVPGKGGCWSRDSFHRVRPGSQGNCRLRGRCHGRAAGSLQECVGRVSATAGVRVEFGP